VTYTVVNHPAAQSGYTISGTITTNGATDTNLPGTDITSWDITIMQGTTTIEEITNTINTIQSGLFGASTTSITVPSPSENIGFNNIGSGGYIGWAYQTTDTTPSIGYGANWPTHFEFLWSSTLTPVTTPIATAKPEPSTAVIAVSGAVTGIAIVLVRKRRARRRQGKSGHTPPTE
jgi:hypothetical protein